MGYPGEQSHTLELGTSNRRSHGNGNDKEGFEEAGRQEDGRAFSQVERKEERPFAQEGRQPLEEVSFFLAN